MAQVDDPAAGAVWLDLAHEQLWRGGQVRHLRPKSFALLRYLVAHPGRVLSKDELVQAVWPETAISDGVLTVSITEIRQALGDAAQAPQYLETVPRRGYRWRGTLPTAALPSASPAPPRALSPPPLPVGRVAEVTQLHQWLAQARFGVRQVGFVTGDAGMGKTTVVDAFVAQVTQEPDLWLVRGQCVEAYGTGEAYRPVLEALGQLCRGPDGARLVAWLAQHAPTWLVQMPALLSADALETVQRRVLGATRERMLRELAEAVEALTVERPLVLVLEDLHWSDAATLDLVGALARRRAPARLLVVGTYRPVEVIVRGHPLQALKLELTLHQQCREVPLELLTAADVTQYLAGRFGAGVCPAALAQVLYRRTDGHPLFLVTVVDALVRQGLVYEVAGRWVVTEDLAVVEALLPESLMQMIVQQFNALPAEVRDMLEVASTAGLESTVAAVAAGVEAAEEMVERQCARLVQRGQFLRAHGVEEWPDGTVTARYSFRHTLYQQAIYERVLVARRVQLHRRIGTRLEVGYGAQAGERAAELAMHFERGHDPERVVRYRQQAAAQALERYAHQEAIRHVSRGLAELQRLAETPERLQQELALQLALGSALMATKGYAAPEVAQTYTRARQLCQHLDDPHQLFPTLRGLWNYYHVRAELQTAHALGEQLLTLAQQVHDTAMLMAAHRALGTTLFMLGAVAAAHTHFAQGIALYDAHRHRAAAFRYGEDVGVTSLSRDSWTLWYLGYPDQALARSQAAVTLAQQSAHPLSLSFALGEAAVFHQLRREGHAAQAHAEAALHLTTDQGFPHWRAYSTILHGWALAHQGEAQAGIEQLHQGLMARRATGAALARPYFLSLLVEAQGATGQPEAGLTALTEALTLVETSGECWYVPELYRLKGTLLLQQSPDHQVEAEVCFQQAISIAQSQQAKSWELRAATSLARLWQQQGKREEARQVLGDVYGWFTEGFDTADLKDAKALLDALA